MCVLSVYVCTCVNTYTCAARGMHKSEDTFQEFSPSTWLRQGPSYFCCCTGFSTLVGCHHGITDARLPSHLFVCLLFFDGGSKDRIPVKCFYSLSYFPVPWTPCVFFLLSFLKYTVLFVKEFSISAIFLYLIVALKY